jgi:hypothetical protein
MGASSRNAPVSCCSATLGPGTHRTQAVRSVDWI